MKILFIHADHITYKTARKARSDVIEEPVSEPRTVKDTLIALLTVEKAMKFRRLQKENLALKNELETLRKKQQG
jgi:hypothetical protein